MSCVYVIIDENWNKFNGQVSATWSSIWQLFNGSLVCNGYQSAQLDLMYKLRNWDSGPQERSRSKDENDGIKQY